MNPLTGTKIVSRQFTIPEIEWSKQPKVWISLATVRLDGGFAFRAQFLPVNALFAESNKNPEEVRVVDLPEGVLGVISGEVEIVRALLEGKAGLEARRYRL